MADEKYYGVFRAKASDSNKSKKLPEFNVIYQIIVGDKRGLEINFEIIDSIDYTLNKIKCDPKSVEEYFENKIDLIKAQEDANKSLDKIGKLDKKIKDLCSKLKDL